MAISLIIANKKATAHPDAFMSAGTVLTHRDEYINMYTEPPQNIISIQELIKLSLDRLRILKKIELMYDSNCDEKLMA
jgi:hypothetical protein